MAVGTQALVGEANTASRKAALRLRMVLVLLNGGTVAILHGKFLALEYNQKNHTNRL